MNVWSQSIAYLTAALALVLDVLLYRKIAKKYPKKRKPISQAFVLGSFVLAAMVIDEECLRFFGIPSDWTGVYTMSFAVKWEIAALLATLVISILYWFEERKRIRKVEDGHLFAAITSSALAIFCLFFAFYFMYKMLFASTKSELVHDFVYHCVSLLLLLSGFLVADCFIWTGVVKTEDPHNHLKNLSHLSVFLVDIPVVASFLILALFCVIHKCEHSYFHYFHQFLAPPARPVEPINLWTAEEYFISGAIAFQYLLSTAIYLVLAFELFEIKPTATDNQRKAGQTELAV